jgi:rare lipoprotein A
MHNSAGVLAAACAFVVLAAHPAGAGAQAGAASEPSAARPTRTNASWYGAEHHGKRTASGEPYDMHAMTAAHPTLPFGTRVVVTNLKNGRRVALRINDRGPTIPGRGIDLSYAAARALGAVGAGVVPVRIAPAPPPAPVQTALRPTPFD